MFKPIFFIFALSIHSFSCCAFYTKKEPSFSNYTIGEWTYGLPKVLDYNDGSSLTIGNFCSIALEVTFVLGGLPEIPSITSYPLEKLFGLAPCRTVAKKDIIVGNDVWIGYNSTILSGVTIGDGAIIGAKSLVAHDVPPYAIVGGVPAKIIRYRVPNHLIDRLVKIAWWNWRRSNIKSAMNLLLSNNIEAFIDRYEHKKMPVKKKRNKTSHAH